MYEDTREESFLNHIKEYDDFPTQKTYIVGPPQVGQPGVHSVCASRFIAHFVPIGVVSVTLDGVPIPFHTECWHRNAQGGVACVHVDFSTPFVLAGESTSQPELVLRWPEHEDEDGDKDEDVDTAQATEAVHFGTDIELDWDIVPGASRIDFGSLVYVPNIFGELHMQDDEPLYPNCQEVDVVGSSAFFARVVNALAEACVPSCHMLWDEREDAGHFGTWMPLLAHHKCLSGRLADMCHEDTNYSPLPPENTVWFTPSSLQPFRYVATVTHSKSSPECGWLKKVWPGLDQVTIMIRKTKDADYTYTSSRHYLIVEEEDGAAWPKVFHNHMWQTLVLS
jgi:hypothetical protein